MDLPRPAPRVDRLTLEEVVGAERIAEIQQAGRIVFHSVGDTGAAMGPLLLCFAALGLKQGHVKEPCIVWCSSDGELRGAVCVSAVPAKEA